METKPTRLLQIPALSKVELLFRFLRAASILPSFNNLPIRLCGDNLNVGSPNSMQALIPELAGRGLRRKAKACLNRLGLAQKADFVGKVQWYVVICCLLLYDK